MKRRCFFYIETACLNGVRLIGENQTVGQSYVRAIWKRDIWFEHSVYSTSVRRVGLVVYLLPELSDLRCYQQDSFNCDMYTHTTGTFPARFSCDKRTTSMRRIRHYRMVMRSQFGFWRIQNRFTETSLSRLNVPVNVISHQVAGNFDFINRLIPYNVFVFIRNKIRNKTKIHLK